jgi:SHS family lactate transporter-like MFS transporter
VGASNAASTSPLGIIRSLTGVQKRTFTASFLGWTLDAFDFFIVTFVLKDIAADFGTGIKEAAFAITITLMFRPLGALIFGVLADRFGRRRPLMYNILFYSLMELLTAFAPNFQVFIVLRALYGIGMGGEWGVGAALALETLPARARGLFSGILQEGYSTGFIIAAIVYFGVYETTHFGWRGMFVVGVLPALLVFYIRSYVPESPAWKKPASRVGQTNQLLASIARNPVLYVYAIVLMAAFNFMSHGSQDLYPTFLQKQHALSVGGTTIVTIIANVGAIVGGTMFGFFSQRFGRKRTIMLSVVLGLCSIPLWIYAPSVALLAVGGFFMQFFVQGAWGIVPIHLNELSPGEVRGTFPGFTYQLGNLITAGAAQIEAGFAETFPVAGAPAGTFDYGHALAIIMALVFAAVFVMTAIGPERRGIALSANEA